jgi:hypothetical protein
VSWVNKDEVSSLEAEIWRSIAAMASTICPMVEAISF